MSYQIFNHNSIIDYVRTLPEVKKYFTPVALDRLVSEEIGDGNLNMVFVVKDPLQPERGIIIKQAVPYLRCIGEDYPLAKERMHYEIGALETYTKLAKAHTPHLFHTDKENCLVVMQYLSRHKIMRKGLIACTYYPKFADHISTFLAETLFRTSSLCLNNAEKDQLIKQYNHNELRTLTENFVFSFPYMEHPTNPERLEIQDLARELRRDDLFKERILELKDLFMNKTDALIHADLHTGSIMANEEETFVIDPEFAFVGPFGFDVGAILANLILSWISHFERSRDNQYQNWIINTIEQMLVQFNQKFIALWDQHRVNALLVEGFLSESQYQKFQQYYLRKILQESVGFAGCKMARRQLGIAGVEDIRGIEDNAARTRAEKLALGLAREFIVNYRNYHEPKDLLRTILHFAPNTMAFV